MRLNDAFSGQVLTVKPARATHACAAVSLCVAAAMMTMGVPAGAQDVPASDRDRDREGERERVRERERDRRASGGGERTSASARVRGDEPAPSRDANAEQGVTVIGSAHRTLDRVPGAATVLSERDVRRTQPLNLGEAVRRVPGVFVRDEEGLGLRPNISVRGLDPTRSRRVLMLEDGIPIALNPYAEPDSYYAPPVERIERIEVIRGAGSILYGPQTIGGVINFVTPAPPTRESAQVSLVGGLPLQYGVRAVYGNRFGNTGFIVSVGRRQGEGLRNMPFEVTDIFARAVMRFGPNSDIIARIGVYDEGSNSTYVGLTTPMFDNHPRQNPAPDDWLRMRRYTVGVIHDWRPTPRVRFRTLAYGYLTDRGWTRQLYERTPYPGFLYARIVGNQSIAGGAIYFLNAARTNERHYEVAGLEPRMQANFTTGPLRHDIDLGARVLVERAVARQLFGSHSTDRSGSLDEEEQRDGVAVAGFVQDRVSVLPMLQFTPGVRVESYSFWRRIRRHQAMDAQVAGAGHAFTVIPGFSVSAGTPSVTVFGGVHSGWSPPRITVAVNPCNGAERRLEPERSVNLEVGARVNVGSWLRTEATAFRIDFLNEVIAGSYAGGTSTANPFDPARCSALQTEFVNGGSSRYLGFETMGSADIGRLARWPTSLYVTARYTAVDARFTSNAPDDPMDRTRGNFVPYAVPHTFAASVGVEHPLGFAAQATWLVVSEHYTDRQNSREPSAAGTVGVLPSYNVFDATVRYTHRRSGLGVTLNVKNAFDLTYAATRLPDGVFPGPFRQILLGLRWER